MKGERESEGGTVERDKCISTELKEESGQVDRRLDKKNKLIN